MVGSSQVRPELPHLSDSQAGSPRRTKPAGKRGFLGSHPVSRWTTHATQRLHLDRVADRIQPGGKEGWQGLERPPTAG